MQFQGRKKIDATLDIAPLVDVIFLLLLFFMLASSFTRSHAIQVDLPTAGAATPMKLQRIEIVIQADGGLTVNHQPVNTDQLIAQIHKLRDQEQPIAIRAHRHSRTEQLVQVIDQLQQAGIFRYSLIAQRTEQP